MTALETALALLAEGLWPVPITAPNDPNPRLLSPGKQPIGKGWGLKRPTTQSLRRVFEANPGAGVGLKLGPEGGVIDIDVDDPARALSVIARLFSGSEPMTRGWSSTRGRHWLFRWDERFARYGKALVKNHPAYAGVEIRFGWSAEGKQYQTVLPPSAGTNGTPRVWNEYTEILSPPESFFEDLDSHLNNPVPTPGTRPVDEARAIVVWDAERRAVAYLQKCQPAVSGQRGHDKAFIVACKVGPGFDLHPDTALRLIRDFYNPACLPPWSDRELAHKVEDAYRVETRRGWFLEEPEPRTGTVALGVLNDKAPGPAENFDDPFRLARTFLANRSLRNGTLTLRFWLEEWHQWDGARYRVVSETELRAAVGSHVKEEFDRIAIETTKPPGKVTRTLLGNVLIALVSLSILTANECRERPAWLGFDGEDQPDPVEVVVARNGLIHLPALVEGRRGLLPPTPRFFSPNCLGFDFLEDAPRPAHWLNFLDGLWGTEPDSIASLQEWFGYLLTPDTSQQKMLVIIGPPRSGKGTIGRTLTSLLGEPNVVNPTLSSLTNEFRVAPLIGRTLAIFSDARLNGRADVPVIVERLLSISGEDSQTIDRKNKDSWSGKLKTRFILMANELPQLTDASKAVTSRTVILRLTKSFLGREDRTLAAKIEGELPAILLWSIAGWARLKQRGYFEQPTSGEVLVKELDEITSPVSSFLAECCEVEPGEEVSTAELYLAWKAWCTENGRDHPGPATTLGRYLRAAIPDIETIVKREKGKYQRFFQGVRLTDFRPS